MKTTRSTHTVPSLMAVAFLAVGLLMQPSSASAKDNWNNNRGYQKHGYNMPPGQYKKYYGNGHNYNRGAYYRPQPQYVTYQGRRGYWQQNEGVRIFINLN